MKEIKTIVLLMSIMLIGCVAPEITIHKREVQACKQQCTIKAQHCSQVCKNSCPRCLHADKIRVTKRYQRYVNQQSIQGLEIPRDLQSYRDPLQCRKTTCNCSAETNECLQACSGFIKKQLKVIPACC